MNEVISGQGATKERMKHSQIVTEQRGRRLGSLGQRDTEHCTLDWLQVRGLLGNNDRDRDDRYNSGYRLRSLYYSFTRTGKSLDEMGSGPGYQYAGEETSADKAEAKYHAVMRALPKKYHEPVRFICIEGMGAIMFPDDDNERIKAEKTEQLMWAIHDSLDALFGAFERVR